MKPGFDPTTFEVVATPKGQTPVVRVCNQRENVSLISTVTNRGKVRWMVFDGALNAKILIGFFKRLIKEADRKIFLILDNLRVRHAKIVRQWLDANAEWIEVFDLPSYRPELNPDECLNADLKQAVTTTAPLRGKGPLKKAAVSHLRMLSMSPTCIASYFQHNPVHDAA